MALDTGHLRVRHINQGMHDTFALRAHAELLNYAFPLLMQGRPNGLKAITQLCSGCPSLWNGEISIESDGNLTVDEDSGGMKMKKDFEVHFWDLSERVRHKLEDSFIRGLFDKASGNNLNELAKKLNFSYPYVCHLRRGLYSIPNSILIKLAEMAKVDLSVVERHIVYTRTRHGNISNIKFPILPSKAMASLVGHVFGDGYIGNKKRQFEYCNDNKELLREVKKFVRLIFGLEPMTERWNRIGYSTLVGEVLVSFGAHLAPKIKSEKMVPQWVKEGSREFKAAFLKALFDDDGSVMFSENYRAKGVNFYQIRDKKITESSHRLLTQISEMLSGFDIYSGKPRIRKSYLSDGEEHTISYINITDYQSITNFYKSISLAKGDKLTRLQKIISKRKPMNVRKRTNALSFGKGDEDVVENKPKKVLLIGSGALTIGQGGESLIRQDE